MSNKRDRNKDGKRRGQPRDSTSLAQHERVGNKVKPPLAALADKYPVKSRFWQRDDLPNHLWALGHLAIDIDAGLRLLNVALQDVRNVVAPFGYQEPITGTLLSFEAVPDDVRLAVLAALQRSGSYDTYFPVDWARAISLYDGAPGRWTADLHFQRGLVSDVTAGRRWFGAAIEAGAHGQSVASTRAKTVVVAGVFVAGRLLNMEREVLDIGLRYPHVTEHERSIFEPTMRATYGGIAALNDGGERVATLWARGFWRTNWQLYQCEALESVLDVDADQQAVSDQDGAERRENMVSYFRGRVAALEQRFGQLSRCDPDLYDPDRYEVLTGLAARSIGQARAAIQSPILWTSDFGSWLLRSSVETKIVMSWLEHTGGDIYAGYKDYGRGRLKLLKLHVESYIDESGGAVDPGAHEYLEALTAEVNQDIWEEWQEISIEKTFSGINARAMAIDVGLKTDYDLAFAPASSTTHGDWAALDRLALTRCMNPLHRWHRIRRETMHQVLAPELLDRVLDYVDDVLDVYERALRADKNQ
jgi:hypothetical protein